MYQPLPFFCIKICDGLEYSQNGHIDIKNDIFSLEADYIKACLKLVVESSHYLDYLIDYQCSGAQYLCSYQGCSEDKNLTIDHIKPISKGGSDDLNNLQFMCLSHNSKKREQGG